MEFQPPGSVAAWRAARAQALRKTPDKVLRERLKSLKALNSVRSALPQLTAGCKDSPALAQTKAGNPAASQSSQPNAAAVSSKGINREASQTGHVSETGTVAKQATATQDRAGSAQLAKPGAAQQLPEQPKPVQLQPAEGLPATAPAQSSDSQPMAASDAIGVKKQKTGQQGQGASASQARDATGVDSAALGPESQVVGKHAASAVKPLSKPQSVSRKAVSSSQSNNELEDEQSTLAQSLKTKKRNQWLLDARRPVQQPKGIPALKGPSRLQSARALDSKISTRAEQEGHSRSQTGKRHRSSSAETGTEGSFQSQAKAGQAPEGRTSGADVAGNRLPQTQARGSEKV